MCVCGGWSGGEMSPPGVLLISMPHPLGRGSKTHSWWICHGRTLYWWRRQPRHQKSNHWDSLVLLEFRCSVCLCSVCPLLKQKTGNISAFHYCFLQITRKVIRRMVIPQERKQDVVKEKVEDESFVNALVYAANRLAWAVWQLEAFAAPDSLCIWSGSKTKTFLPNIL